MLLSLFIVLVAVTSTLSAAVLNVARQAPESPCPAPATVYVTVTATVIEGVDIPSVTVANPDPASIASFISYAASIDTEYYLMESELAPESEFGPYPDTTTFVNTIDVPAFLATSVIDGSTIFYKPDADLPQSVPYTTFTIEVVHPTFTHQVQGHGLNETVPNSTALTTMVSQTESSSSYASPTNTNTSVISDVGTESPAGMLTVTATTNVATTTVTASTAPAQGPEYSNSGYAPLSANQTSNADLERRQTCTLVQNPTFGTWCNNWDGSTTLPYTTWETTTTPGVTESQQPSTTQPQPTPSGSPCGETGAFTIDFEDLPEFSTNDNDTSEYPPIFNPHDHFDWGTNWTYGPPPNSLYLPHDGTHLAEVFPASVAASSILTDGVPPMGFGAGYRDADEHYWFNAYSAWVGCNNTSPDPTITCDFVATAYQYDYARARDIVVSTQHFTEEPCDLQSGCQLQEIQFEASFRNLSTMSFYAVVLGQPVTLYIDSLALDWYNNTCAAGLARASSRKF